MSECADLNVNRITRYINKDIIKVLCLRKCRNVSLNCFCDNLIDFFLEVVMSSEELIGLALLMTTDLFCCSPNCTLL